MAAVWKRGQKLANCQTFGIQSTVSLGVYLYSGASAFVKGSYVTLTTGNTYDTQWVEVRISNVYSAGSNQVAVDLAIGAIGSEVIVANNLVLSTYALSIMASYFFPCNIPAGTRIAARVSSNYASSDYVACSVSCFDSGIVNPGAPGLVDTYGFNTATNIGTLLDSGGVADTKGSYVQITSGLTYDISGFFVGWDTQAQSTGSVGDIGHLVDISCGASNFIIIPDLQVVALTYSGASLMVSPQTVYYPIPIAAGTRISMRQQTHTTNTPDRYLGATLYGVRL